MAQLPIVRRTEKLRDITALLKSRKIVYLSAFFYSGKTVLMDQLCDSWDGKVLRFDSSRDDWEALFTDRDYQVYSLMIAGYKNAKIASILNISERTVKYFCGLIYQKLGVSTRAEALNKSAELGDI